MVKKDSVLLVKDIAANYGGDDVIRDINFEVGAGEIFGLMGLNGVGKTTFIKVLLGLMASSSGSIKFFGGNDLDKSSKEKLAYLPERFEPPNFLSGIEFIKFSLKLYNREIDEKEIIEAAERVSLDEKALRRRVNTYSKGMRQKVGLLGTLLTKCPLLILDEPMSGLDPRARANVKDEILKCKKEGITVFMSSHILADMDEICDRVSVIHGGDLLFVGTPAELKKQSGQEYLERAFLETIDSQKAA